MRGQRLGQLQYVDDDMYQLMLECWQLDLDERPAFQEIAHVLENMLQDSTVCSVSSLHKHGTETHTQVSTQKVKTFQHSQISLSMKRGGNTVKVAPC